MTQNNNRKKKVAIVGTNGIPAKYGGYEILAEFLTKYLSTEFDITVYCSKTQPSRIKEHNGAKLEYFALKANGWLSLFYDIFTLFHAALKSDVILYLGPGAGFVIPFLSLFKKRIIVNHGGLNEWQREKYSGFQKFVARIGHKYAGKYASFNIADNFLLRDSLKSTFGVDSIVVRYGGNHAIRVEVDEELEKKYPFLREKYFVNVSRAQIDNNLHLVIDAFKKNPEKKLVMISNWSFSSYGRKLKSLYENKFPNILLLDPIYEFKEINAIRSNAYAYIHSHSYCGTSPSLVEVMSLGLPVFSFDVPTNRETTHNEAFYFANVDKLIELVFSTSYKDLLKNSAKMKSIADEEYTWEIISLKYSELFNS